MAHFLEWDPRFDCYVIDVEIELRLQISIITLYSIVKVSMYPNKNLTNMQFR